MKKLGELRGRCRKTSECRSFDNCFHQLRNSYEFRYPKIKVGQSTKTSHALGSVFRFQVELALEGRR